MEKRTPHCPLAIVKNLADQGKVTQSYAAMLGATKLGFDLQGVIEILLSLSYSDFYKSMTTYADHRIWQDVYHPTTTAGTVYLKLTVTEGVLVVSFKEL